MKPPDTSGKDTEKSLISQLSNIIARETAKLEAYFRSNPALPPWGFGEDDLLRMPSYSPELQQVRETIADASRKLAMLVRGPEETLRWMAWDHNDQLSLQAITHFKIAQAVPIHGKRSFAKIATEVGLSEVNVRRFLRHAMTNQIFREAAPGEVGHTAASRLLAEDAILADWVGFCVDDMFPAAARTVQALIDYPAASEPTQTGFCLANDTVNKETLFTTFGRSPLRAKRMGGAMTSLTSGEGYEVSHLLEHHLWGKLNDRDGGATIVDLGGSHGAVCATLAKYYPNLRFIVQDLPKTIDSVPSSLKEEGRITFQAHDFFTPQPVHGADVYLFRWIIHNHSDKYATRLLRALIPALKKGARIFINEHCLRDGDGATASAAKDERIIRTMDLVMLTLLNAQERTQADFRKLFKMADPRRDRFRFLCVWSFEGSRMSVVEAEWVGGDYEQADEEDQGEK